MSPRRESELIHSKVYWSSQEEKEALVADAKRLHKSTSELIALCCNARREPLAFLEITRLFGIPFETMVPEQRDAQRAEELGNLRQALAAANARADSAERRLARYEAAAVRASEALDEVARDLARQTREAGS